MTIDDVHPTAEPLENWPAFIKELSGTLSVHSQYVLYGNIRDRYLIYPREPLPGEEPRPVLQPLITTIWEALKHDGYSCVIAFDPVNGLTTHPQTGPDQEKAGAAARIHTGEKWPDLPLMKIPFNLLITALSRTAGPPSLAEAPRMVFVIDDAARIAQSPAQLATDERAFFRFCENLSRTTIPRDGPPGTRKQLFNPVIWLTESERDLPTWLTAGNERIRTIGIPLPDLEARNRAARAQAEILRRPLDDPDVVKVVETLAAETDGMTLQAIQEIRRLAKDRGIDFAEISDAVRMYKLGIENSPWRRDHIRVQIKKGEEQIPKMVRGQQQAVEKTLDILKRAALGLSGAQATSSVSRPRGVLFLAGPTGVGKTELAKAVAKTLFGESSTPLRFDMSEFSAEQAADRLIGAPPGYVGHEAGGELTGAIRRDPFRVVLFDEIEKAHPHILDKFLQILEDGRLTDGQGTTVYFSEAVLVFTSNLGIMAPDSEAQQTNPFSTKKKAIVDAKESYDEVERKVREAVSQHFVEELGRPELLNRFGDNIVVFSFIDEDTAAEIFDMQIENTTQRVADELQVHIDIDEGVREELRKICTGELGNGGRGIGMALEAHFINPLSRELFGREDLAAGSRLTVYAIYREDSRIRLDLR
jgi:hypothetical protein